MNVWHWQKKNPASQEFAGESSYENHKNKLKSLSYASFPGF